MSAAEAAANGDGQARPIAQRAHKGHDFFGNIFVVSLLPIGTPLTIIRTEPALGVNRIDRHEPDHAPVEPACERFCHARRFIGIGKHLSRREGEHGRAVCPIRSDSHFFLQPFAVPAIHSRFHIHPLPIVP